MKLGNQRGSGLGLPLYIKPSSTSSSSLTVLETVTLSPIFSQWINTIPLDFTRFTEHRALLKICGPSELPFATHRKDISRWIDALLPYAVVVLNPVSKWKPFSDGLRRANFHRLWQSITSQVTLAKGSWRKGKLRLSKSDGIVVWVSEGLHEHTRVEEDEFLFQYDQWPNFLSRKKIYE